MPATHLEIETTFDTDPDAELPDLSTAPGVAAVARVPTMRLVAMYHDTDDLRLLRSRITLRRRTGGEDPGWHLKLPADVGRLEVHVPPGRPVTRVPGDLVSLTRSVTRGAELGVIARVTTWRKVERLLGENGDVLAEVAVDDVLAEVMTGGSPDGARTSARQEWHEVEVELVEGGPDLLETLTALLRDAGARPAAVQSKIARALGELPAAPALPGPSTRKGPGRGSAGAVALAYCRAQVEEIRRLDPHVRLDTEDAVHQMRVAARRLRSALATFRPVLDKATTEPVRGELRWLGQALGEARDLEVLRERLSARVEALAARDADLVRGPVAERLRAELDRRRAAALDDARTAMDSERYLGLLDRLDRLVDDPPYTGAASRKARALLRERTGRDVGRVFDRAEKADQASGPAHDALLHEVRKAAKRARYAAEAVEPALGGKAGAVADRMKKVQQVLGVRQDRIVAGEVLADVARDVHAAGEDTFTYGLLAGLETPGTGQADSDTQAVAAALAKARKAADRL